MEEQVKKEKVLEPYQEIERALIKKFRKPIWRKFTQAINDYDLIQEGLAAKLLQISPEVRGKFRGTLTRIVNEGATGLICLIL